MESLAYHAETNLQLMIIGKAIASLGHSLLMSYTIRARLINKPSRSTSMAVERLLMSTLVSHRATQ